MIRIRKLPALLLIAAVCLLFAACGKQQTTVIATIANRSGYDVTSVSITPSTSDMWDTEYLDETFADGDSFMADLGTYNEGEVPQFNILVSIGDEERLYDSAVEGICFDIRNGDYIVFLPPEEASGIVICNEDEFFSLYDTRNTPAVEEEEEETEEDEAENTAEEDFGYLAGYTGCYKPENEPFYFVIKANGEWTATDLYGNQIGPGRTAAAENGILLNLEDGSALTSITRGTDGTLKDAKGNALIPSDTILLLPTPQDALTQTTAFPGIFSDVTVSYPAQMTANKKANMSHAMSFNAVMEDGTDDFYSNIMIAFEPISGFDPYMEKGAATAKTYMMIMLEQLLSSMYGDKLIKTYGTDFTDNGSYYSLTGYNWFDGSIFQGDLKQPVRGCVELRYYGPTGYAVVASSIALESRIQNYYDICRHMLTTFSYNVGWSTAPKPVPPQPQAKPKSAATGQKNTNKGSGSDAGDYGAPYYWYDADGDIWYWNGSGNEFIGYGDEGYIDDATGAYQETNDYGWDDYDDDYYDDFDPWSDTGDYYEDWSDAGDAYFDYDDWSDSGDYDGWYDYYD